MNQHVPAITGNGVSLLALVASYASQINSILQLAATLLAMLAAGATFVYYWKKAKKL